MWPNLILPLSRLKKILQMMRKIKATYDLFTGFFITERVAHNVNKQLDDAA